MLIDNTGNFVRHVGGVKLVPGINELNDKEAKAYTNRITSNKVDAFLVSSNELVEVKSKGKTIQSIADMTVTEASDLIGKTASIETLTGWLADEKREAARKGVISALNDRLDVLKPKVDDTEE